MCCVNRHSRNSYNTTSEGGENSITAYLTVDIAAEDAGVEGFLIGMLIAHVIDQSFNTGVSGVTGETLQVLPIAVGATLYVHT